MRLLSFAAAILFAGLAKGQTHSAVMCISEMEMPSAQGAIVNLAGEVTATIGIGRGGVVKKLDIRSGAKVLRNEIEFLLRERTRYSDVCAGESIELRFVYVVEGEPTREVSGRTLFRPPNRFVVVSRPFIPIAEFEKK